MSRRRLLAPTALALTLTLTLAPAAVADSVTTVPDAKGKVNKIQGTVEAESPTEVRVKQVVGGTQTIPVDQVESIAYDGVPSSYSLAVIRENSGNLTEAASEYQKAAAAASDKPFVAQAAQFNYLKILAQSRPTEAISGLDGFIKANPTSRHRGPALELLIRLLIDRKEYDRADGAATQLKAIAWAKDHADVIKARILIRRGKAADAVAALDPMVAASRADTPRGRAARLTRAEALAAEAKYPEAEKAAREIVQAAGPEDAAARAPAYNTLGDILRAAGKPKDALLAYLHTDLLYAHDKEEHARALAHIARLWRELKRDDRADETLVRLKQEYPTSHWLASAGGK